MSKTTVATATTLTTKQLAFLQSAVTQLEDTARRRMYDRVITRPTDVVAAGKLIDNWENKRAAKDRVERDAIKAAADKTREVLLFKAPDVALAAVKALEAVLLRSTL